MSIKQTGLINYLSEINDCKEHVYGRAMNLLKCKGLTEEQKAIRECLFCRYYRSASMCLKKKCYIDEKPNEKPVAKCTGCIYANEVSVCFNGICYKELMTEHKKRWAFRYPRKEDCNEEVKD